MVTYLVISSVEQGPGRGGSGEARHLYSIGTDNHGESWSLFALSSGMELAFRGPWFLRALMNGYILVVYMYVPLT